MNVCDNVRHLAGEIYIFARFCAMINMMKNLKKKLKVMLFQNGEILRYYEKCYVNGEAIESNLLSKQLYGAISYSSIC